MRSKIKNWTSSCNKARSVFLHEFVMQFCNNTHLFYKPNLPGGPSQKLPSGPAVQNYILVFPVIITLKKMKTWWYWTRILLRKAHIFICQVYSTLQNWLLCVWFGGFCMETVVYLYTGPGRPANRWKLLYKFEAPFKTSNAWARAPTRAPSRGLNSVTSSADHLSRSTTCVCFEEPSSLGYTEPFLTQKRPFY